VRERTGMNKMETERERAYVGLETERERTPEVAP
jgi:hypothetical protein